ncbi:MAG TPA: hypothetical protein VN238_03490, partial [Solirubrobacteraceae bacterium]|nr:hypothetical protein [Solirubrobacteraceae bacterium]
RKAGALVVLADGEPAIYVERGGRGFTTLVEDDDPRLRPAFEALAEFVRAGKIKKLDVERANGEPVVGGPLEPLLVDLGFRLGPKKLTLTA